MVALHHRPEIDDMRHAFDSALCQSEQDSSSTRRSYDPSRSGSDNSYRTAATEYSQHSTKRTARTQHGASDSSARYSAHRQPQQSPRCSIETYASTVASEEEVQEELPSLGFDLPEYIPHAGGPTAIPTTPADFSELFPSRRRLLIGHDDSVDGDMNLRVGTEVNIRGQRQDMTLFHLRMHHLGDREFSLRRYCRDSGREVCHSARMLEKLPSKKRPGLTRSLSDALNSLRPKLESRSSTWSTMKRTDSGYGSSLNSSIEVDHDEQKTSWGAAATPRPQAVSPNSIKLEFSNYAQVEVRRTGVKSSKRYEFEYWGSSYSWRRMVRKHGHATSVSYKLTKSGCDRALAHIVSSTLTPMQAEEERQAGRWISPCSMWLADDDVTQGQKDVAE